MWSVRTSRGWGRARHLGWRVFAVLVLAFGLILPWGPVATADDVEPPAGPTAQEAQRARAAVEAGALDVAEAESALARLREELAEAQIRVQSAAADYEEAVASLEAAEEEVRLARAAAERAGRAEASARTALAGVYRSTRHSGGAEGAMGSLEVVLEARDVEDLIGQDAAERAVQRKLGGALGEYSDARAASESADARWSAAREARREAKREAGAAYETAQEAAADLADRTEAAERDRTLLMERLAALRDTSVRIEREREAARAAAASAEREAEAREALDAAPGAGSGAGAGPNPAAPLPEAPPASSEGTGQGQVAVGWARTKIGAPYRLAAEGPTEYDCSGLTSEAWRYAGTWITRTSRSQYVAVGHIGYENLRPGDLIFYGTDGTDPQSIYHVAMYTGDGRMIEAVMPGVALRETELRLDGAMPYAGRP